MLCKTRGFVLHNINYSESSVVSRIYTKDYGLQSFLVNGVRKGKGAIRAAHLMPLNLLDVVIYLKDGGGLQRIKELRCSPQLNTLHFDVVKNSIGLFVCEILMQSIDGDGPNEELFDFVETFITLMDLEEENLANHPLWFMIQLSRYLGFAPTPPSSPEGVLFDFNEGEFVPPRTSLTATMSEGNSYFFAKMLTTPIEELGDLKMPKQYRTSLLDDLIRYYEIHMLNGRKIRSVDVFRALFE